MCLAENLILSAPSGHDALLLAAVMLAYAARLTGSAPGWRIRLARIGLPARA